MSTNRRMRRTRVETMHLCCRTVSKTNEGATMETFGAPVAFNGESWPAGGKVQAEMYGDRLGYIRNLKIRGEYTAAVAPDGGMEYRFADFTVRELDRVCIFNDTAPDFRIISIKPYKPLTMELERISVIGATGATGSTGSTGATGATGNS